MEQHFGYSISGRSEIPSTLAISSEMGSPWGVQRSIHACHPSSDASLFSSSLPIIHEKVNIVGTRHGGLSIDDSSATTNIDGQEKVGDDQFEDTESNVIGIMLPGDEDELLAGITDDFDLGGLPTQLEDLEDDLFGSGGGMEMDFESREGLGFSMSNLNISDGLPVNGIGPHISPNGGGTVAGEHPYGEHPSRTLFVRNINSNVEDSELRSLFEKYGDIRNLYTACKHRGFVMISYYDIRHARAAMRALQSKPLRRRKLDIHYSIPKDNPSEKDVNQGTLVVFNLDASVSNDDLRQIFGAYGEIKEIRETPHKRHHKFIEFYDVRAAEIALKALNKSDIAGKRIKLEPSRPGGARRNLMQQLSLDVDQDEIRTFRHHVGSPVTNSPPGSWAHLSSPVEHTPMQGFSRSPGMETHSPVNSNHLCGLASILPAQVSNPVKIAPIGKDQGRVNHTKPPHDLDQQSLFVPNKKLSVSPGHLSAFGDSSSNSPVFGTLSGPQFLWGSPTAYSDRTDSSPWGSSSGGLHVSSGQGQGQAYPYSNQRGTLLGLHHVGSAPSGIPVEGHFAYFPDSLDTTHVSSVGFRGMGSSASNGNYTTSMIGRKITGFGHAPSGDTIGGCSPSRMMSFPMKGPLYFSNGSYQGVGGMKEGLTEISRSRRAEYSMSQMENKEQYQLDLEKIIKGADSRTTLMIKNIPNKYTSKMLLAAIDENHKGTYDFLYLPIDFKNKCNVGYAFINMVSPSHIISFYQAFNGKKWEKFNSEKVASLAYARIQGKAALITHFQNSSLMNEDKRCRPILFQSKGQGTGDLDSLPYNNLNICILQQDGSYSVDSLDSPTSSLEENHT